MRTHASHGTGRGRSSSASPGLTTLLFAIAAAAALVACGDNDGTDPPDAHIGDGGITDAYVDNGPLDCGVTPYDGAVCVQGRLHDWVTGEAVPAGEELRVFTFFQFVGTGDFEAARDAPDSHKGRVVPNGRFYAWVDGSSEGQQGCAATVEDVPGYLPATVNCYDRMWEHPELFYRFYVVPEAVIPDWVAAYDGFADLANDRPIFLGQCLDSDWSRLGAGDGQMRVDGSGLPHSDWWSVQEMRHFHADRLGFFPGDGLAVELPRDTPPGGAAIYYLARECPGCEGTLTDFNFGLVCRDREFGAGSSFSVAVTDSGEVGVVILNAVAP